jgi:hypothetical protein
MVQALDSDDEALAQRLHANIAKTFDKTTDRYRSRTVLGVNTNADGSAISPQSAETPAEAIIPKQSPLDQFDNTKATPTPIEWYSITTQANPNPQGVALNFEDILRNVPGGQSLSNVGVGDTLQSGVNLLYSPELKRFVDSIPLVNLFRPPPGIEKLFGLGKKK